MRIAPALLLFAALLASPAVAQDRSASAFATFERTIEDTKAAIMGDPAHALAKSRRALALARTLPSTPQGDVARATALWLMAEACMGLNQLQDARAPLDEALALVTRQAPRTKLHGDLLRTRGGLASLNGQIQAALRDYIAAHTIFQRAKEPRSQALVLQDIAQIYAEAGDFERQLRYAEQANELVPAADLPLLVANHNNMGETLRALGRRADAEREYQAALDYARKLSSPVLETRILSNLALVQVDKGQLAAAQRNADRALRLSAIGEASEWRPFVYGVEAKIADARGDYDRAADMLERAFRNDDFETTEIGFKEFHELGASLYEKLGRADLALAHLKAFQRLERETARLTASASSQLMSARFDFTNQNLRISQLKQGQLERDVRIERQRTQFRTNLFTGLGIAGLMVISLVLIAFFSIRRSRNDVRAANSVLTVVNAKLEKALKAKTEFLAMTSHEIRTPLNGILGMTQVMLAGRRMEPDVREQVQLVQGAGETMKALVDDLLDVAKMETGEVTVEMMPTALPPILQDATQLWRGQAEAKGLTLALDLTDAPQMIETDGGRVRQVIFNLLSNAIKFTAAGHVTLSVSRDRAMGRLLLRVADTGIGIPAEQQEAIFDAFHQVDCGTTRQFSGTGLGLAICRNLVEALGGTITVESVESVGSTFTVSLPLREVEAVVRVAPERLRDARILVIDGNAMKAAVLAGLIEPQVAAADVGTDLSAARNALASASTDHLIIDVRSTAVEGTGSLGAIVDQARAAAVRVTLLLAPTDDLTVERTAALCADQLLLKPLAGAALTAALHQLYEPAASAPQIDPLPISSAA